MTPEDLKRLITQGESTRLDFKRDLREETFRDLAKDFAAFSNAEGGHILVGVDNVTKQIVGVDWNQEKESRVYQEAAKCTPKIQPTSVITAYVHRKGTVVMIEIAKSNSIHSDDHQKFPLRVGDSTTYMDAPLILAVAKGKGLISGEAQIQPPTSTVRHRPKRIAFLGGYLSHSSSFIRAEALSDIASVAYNFAVEEIPHLETQLYNLLGDSDVTVRLTTLNVISSLYFRMSPEKKRRYLKRMTQRIGDMAIHDKEMSVRARALSVLCEVGAPSVVGIIVQLITKEPQEAYVNLGVVNNFVRVVENGLGYDLRKRLYVEISKAQDSEIQGRLKVALANLRNVYWAR